VTRAGIYLGGRDRAQDPAALRWDEFLAAFRDKDHLRPILSRIPVSVITNEHTGLLGAARLRGRGRGLSAGAPLAILPL